MTDRCSYFDLYDGATDSLTAWAVRILERVDLPKYRIGEKPVANPRERFCAQHGVDPEDVTVPGEQIRHLVYAQYEKRLPRQCPHESHPQASHCIFHMSAAERDEHGVSASDVQEQLVAYINDEESPYLLETVDTGETAGDPSKCLVGARLSGMQLNLAYQTLDPPHNHPIDLRFLKVDGLRLQHGDVSSPLLLDYISSQTIDISRTRFRRDLSLANGRMEGGTFRATYTVFEGGLDATEMGIISPKRIDFEQAVFGGQETSFADARLLAETVSFSSATFESQSTIFNECVFLSRDPGRATVDFSDARFSGKEAAFVDVQFGYEPGDSSVLLPTQDGFQPAEYGVSGTRSAELDLSRATVRNNTFLLSGQLYGELDCDKLSVRSQSFSVSDLRIEGRTKLDEADFSRSQFDCRDVDLENLVFSFPKNGPAVSFDNCDFNESNVSLAVNSTNTDITFEEATINDGNLHRTGDTEHVIDLTRASLGDVMLQPSDEQTLFENFRIFRTTFDGFQFSEHRSSLDASNWYLHTTDVVPEGDDRGFVASLSAVFPVVNLAAAPDRDYEAMEDTYRRAKNGADKVGDSKATSAFFQREMGYRRAQYRRRLAEAASLPARLKATGQYTANSGLMVLTGYGEKPIWTGIMSVCFVFLFAALFRLIWLFDGPPEGAFDSPVGGLVLSIQSFTSLTLLEGEVNSELVVALTYLMGFVGPFMIALLVFALTRSIRR